jgi:hypothetical protein
MSLLTNVPILGKIFSKTIDIIEKIVPDKDMQAKIKGELAIADYSAIIKEVDAQAQILAAELTGNKLQRSWRPILMYFIMAMLFWLIVIVPAIAAFGIEIPIADALDSVPAPMWTLLTTGVGGYTVLRSGEKMMESWAKKGK